MESTECCRKHVVNKHFVSETPRQVLFQKLCKYSKVKTLYLSVMDIKNVDDLIIDVAMLVNRWGKFISTIRS